MQKGYLTDDEWENAMSKAEDRVLQFSGIPIKKDFIWIEMDGKPFRVRTFDFGDRNKKTLVLVNGYNANALRHSNIFADLSERYRVVTFDHGSYGMNTKLRDCSGYASYEAAEEWMRD